MLDVIFNPVTLEADLRVENGRFTRRDWWQAAVIQSLFTDAVAPADLQSADERGGYWGDSLNGESRGSLLWLLKREKITAQTLERVRTYALEALAWLKTAGHATHIDATVTRSGLDRIDLNIYITKSTGESWQKTFGGVNAA